KHRILFHRNVDSRSLHSFPTRRSSDLAALAVAGGNGHGAGLTVAAGGLLVVSVIMSVLLLVPLNDRGKKWTPEHRPADWKEQAQDRKSTRLNSSHVKKSYAVFCLKKKN